MRGCYGLCVAMGTFIGEDEVTMDLFKSHGFLLRYLKKRRKKEDIQRSLVAKEDL